MRSSDSDDDASREDDDAVDDVDDADEPAVYSQRDVREMNARALREGTLETSRGAFVRGFLVGDPMVTLRAAFKSPFPNAPNRSGALGERWRGLEWMDGADANRGTGSARAEGRARCVFARLTGGISRARS